MSKPLSEHDDRRVYGGDEGPKVYAAPGYMLFLSEMWGGRWQEIPLDPDRVDAFIAALQEAREYAESHPAEVS